MTRIRAKLIGEKAVLSRAELERLVDLARRSGEVELQVSEEDVLALEVMRLAEQSGAFDFWKEKGEDIYTPQDGEPV